MSTAAQADTLTEITSPSAQNANDSVKWGQLGGDATALGTSFSATSVLGFSLAGRFAGTAQASLIAAACPASPCSWGGGTAGSTPFGAGDLLIWTAARSSGNGPLIFHLAPQVSGAGVLIQEDAPGQFTAQIEVFNGTTLLHAFSEPSDANGDPIYIGVIDTSGANINKVVFSISSTTNPVGDITDFALGTLLLRTPGGAVLHYSPSQGKFGRVKVDRIKHMKFHLRNRAHKSSPSITISAVEVKGSPEFSILSSKTTCIAGTVLAPKHQCHVDVQFEPVSPGLPSATLSIEDDAANAPQMIPLSGKGR
jgi:hypothetical protein